MYTALAIESNDILIGLTDQGKTRINSNNYKFIAVLKILYERGL